MGLAKKALGVYRRYGFYGFCLKLTEKINSPMRAYNRRIEEFLPTKEEQKEQMNTHFAYEPYISIVIPAYETKEEFLLQLLSSIEKQTYQRIELCIADASKSNQVEKVIRKTKEKWVSTNPCLKLSYKHLTENKGISLNTNEALTLVSGEYVGFMDHDDILSLNALYEVVKLLNLHSTAEIIYSDEDKVSYDLKRHTQPHFKPDFNLELVRDNNYICHFLVVSKELLNKVGGFLPEYDGSQDYDFVLRCIEQTKNIYHIPKVLYHWRMHKASTAGDSDSKSYTFDAGQRALMAHLKRQQITATVEKRIEVGCFHIKYEVPKIDESKYLLELSNQIQPLHKEQLDELYSYCAQEKVGIVAAKVLKANHKIKQNGYILRKNGTAARAFEDLREEYKGYVRRAVLVQDLNAVSLDCAVIKKEAFDAVGGFDVSLPRPYREIDFCIRLRKAGYRVIQNSSVVAVEKKDVSSKSYKTALKLKSDDIESKAHGTITKSDARNRIINKHNAFLENGDCFYNPNFSENKKTFSI